MVSFNVAKMKVSLEVTMYSEYCKNMSAISNDQQ